LRRGLKDGKKGLLVARQGDLWPSGEEHKMSNENGGGASRGSHRRTGKIESNRRRGSLDERVETLRAGLKTLGKRASKERKRERRRWSLGTERVGSKAYISISDSGSLFRGSFKAKEARKRGSISRESGGRKRKGD